MTKRNLGLRAGFTLIEILVVISIIGILMGSLITATANARSTALRLKAESETRELINAIRAYEIACNDLPSAIQGIAGSESGVEVTWDLIRELVEPSANPQNLVFLNIRVEEGRPFLDPYGKPYILRAVKHNEKGVLQTFKTAICVPNAISGDDKDFYKAPGKK